MEEPYRIAMRVEEELNRELASLLTPEALQRIQYAENEWLAHAVFGIAEPLLWEGDQA